MTRDAVAGKAAVAVRYAADMTDPESFDAFGAMAELPDLWDLNVHDYGVEMGVSRFTGEAAMQEHVRRARAMTAKPVVAVGRFTSPDTMARVIREGVQDLIGAARPSIADPFLPKKIEEGRIEDIRECIGCNICYAHNTSRRADPLHPEPDHGRGAPSRLAPGARSPDVRPAAGTGSRRRGRPRRTGGGQDPG